MAFLQKLCTLSPFPILVSTFPKLYPFYEVKAFLETLVLTYPG